VQDPKNLFYMLSLTELTSKLSECKWWRLDAMLSQVQLDIDDVRNALAMGANSVECERLQRKATGRVAMNQLLFDLATEHADFSHSLRLLQQEEGLGDWTDYFASDMCFFLLYLVDLTNIFAVSLYMTGISLDILDGWLCVYPVLQLLFVVPTWFKHISSGRSGFFAWLLSYDEPTQFFSRSLTVVCITASFVGLGMLQSDSTVPQNVSRTLLSATCFLTFVHSKHFNAVTNMLSRALMCVVPFFSTMLVFALLFGKFCQDVYGADVDVNSYFGDLRDILVTTFRIFTAEGWHEIMWQLSSRTNLGTTALFCAYVFISSLLLGQLILGVIITISEDVLSFKSMRMHKLIAPYLKGLEDHEQKAFLINFFTVSCQLFHILEEIHQLQSGRCPMLWAQEKTPPLAPATVSTSLAKAAGALITKQSSDSVFSDLADIRTCTPQVHDGCEMRSMC